MKNGFEEVRNILFDLDGTLVDGSVTISTCIDYALGRVGVSVDSGPPIESLIGMSLLDIFCKHFGMTVESAEIAIFHYREHFDRLAQEGSLVYPDIRSVLSRLQASGYRLYIATVKPTSIAEKVLGDLEMLSCFNGVAGSSMTHERRHKSAIIAHALGKYDLDPAQSMMVGDRAQDISGARENGLLAMAVTWGFGAREELNAARPDHVLDQSIQLLELLNAH